VSADQLPAAVLHEAEQLAGRYPAGLTAVITNHPQLVSDRIRNAGWTRGHQAWTRDELKVVVLSPPDARGLEYDGVVVVEPAEFPQNVGRSGPLYTSLTRAVQELTVVHARPLPSGLPSGS
jgi:superfamily I DNA/RNA helicase